MNMIQNGQHICIICENSTNSAFSKEVTGFANITYLSDGEILKIKEICLYNAVLVDCGVKVTDQLINKLYTITKPNGCICIRYVSKELDPELLLKTNGYIKVATKTEPIQEVTGFKPKYEVGSAVKLILPSSTVWKLDDGINDEEVETIDPDNLLDEEDFIKPDQSSLRVCGTTGKRKACKDCSCGLAEELDAEQALKKPINSSEAKSSCGSCYLGDAFRCASCPYLGFPAFKPGEKVQLTDNFLKADV